MVKHYINRNITDCGAVAMQTSPQEIYLTKLQFSTNCENMSFKNTSLQNCVITVQYEQNKFQLFYIHFHIIVSLYFFSEFCLSESTD